MTQTQWIHKWLKRFGHIDRRLASHYGIERLSPRILELKKLGVPVLTRRKKVKTRWDNCETYVAEYYLERK